MSLDADLDVVDAKAAAVERAFGLLDEVEAEGREALDETRTFFAVERALQEAAEATLDVASHLVARNGHRNAEDYADLFAVLREEGVLPADLAERLAELARFRNVLVHQYAEIDPDKVWGYVKDDREDVVAFFDRVYEALG